MSAATATVRELALNLNPDVKTDVTDDEKLRLTHYVFNPGPDINTTDSYVQYPVLYGGVLTRINKAVDNVCKRGGLNDLEGPKLVKQPIFQRYIALQFEDNYADRGVINVEPFVGLESKLVQQIFDTVILPEIPQNGYETQEMLEEKSIEKRMNIAHKILVRLADEYDQPDLEEKILAAAVAMRRSIKDCLAKIEAYIQQSLHEVSEGRAGRFGKTTLDECDVRYMKWLGLDIPSDYLLFRLKDENQGIREAVAQAVAETVKGVQSTQLDTVALSQIISASVAQTLQLMGFAPPTAEPTDKKSKEK